MAQFYSPELPGRIPAQYGDNFSIAFTPSRATPTTPMAIKIKNLTTDKVYIDGLEGIALYDKELKQWFAKFDFSEQEKNMKPSEVLSKGQYYKIQIAHCKSPLRGNDGALIVDNLGTYSTVGVFKYTGEPSVITNWDSGTIACRYKNNDLSETIDWYQIDVYNMAQQLVSSSGKVTNNSENFEFKQIEGVNCIPFGFTPTLIENGPYTYKCRVVTINELVCEITNSIDSLNLKTWNEGEILSSCSSIRDEGLVRFKLFTQDESTYTLLRKKTDEEAWYILYEWKPSKKGEEIILLDKSCEQYEEYVYSIQKTGYEKYHIMTTICDFEDCFLSDSEKQLKIRFNPKVTNFKRTLQETKTDTIGGTHPIFFRNGKLNYFEFSINGLISINMDDNQLFSQSYLEETSSRIKTPDGNSNELMTAAKQFQLERKFKREVYDWLTNGQPKLFRSSTEGNFIVRLMNVNLTPEDQLGRMLHSFSATACEIAPYTTENLLQSKYNLAVIRETATFNPPPGQPEVRTIVYDGGGVE